MTGLKIRNTTAKKEDYSIFRLDLSHRQTPVQECEQALTEATKNGLGLNGGKAEHTETYLNLTTMKKD